MALQGAAVSAEDRRQAEIAAAVEGNQLVGAGDTVLVHSKDAPEEGRATLAPKDLDPSEALEFAAEMAADMETGDYIDSGGKIWPARSFVIAEVLRRMGYGATYVANARHPRWWPRGGTSAFRKYVAWKVSMRAVSYQRGYKEAAPLLESLFLMSVAEAGRRLATEPEKLEMREINDLVTKLAHSFAKANMPTPGIGMPISGGGADAFVQITAAFKNLPAGPARERVEAIMRDILHRGTDAIDAAKRDEGAA